MGDDPGRVAWRGDPVVRWVVGALAILFLVLGVVRAAVYLRTAAGLLPFPLESHQLEAKMVLMAYRAQAGLSLYPEWRDYPHVANFFAPIDFLLVGGIGRLAGADLRGLFLIGRGVSFASGLIVAIVLGVWAGRRYGRGAGIVAAILSLGIRPMDGFSVTTRPDMLAELLGLAGFLLTGARAQGWRVAGVGVLVLAAFTKQTAAVYLLAASAALASEGRDVGRSACSSGGWPRSRWSSRGSRSPSSRTSPGRCSARRRRRGTSPRWLDLMGRLAAGSPDVLVLPRDRPCRSGPGAATATPRLAALAAIPMTAALVASMKRGADVNYFLGLRAAEAMAAAALWSAARGTGPARRSPVLAVALAAAAASLAVSTLVTALVDMKAQLALESFAGPAGQQSLPGTRRWPGSRPTRRAGS